MTRLPVTIVMATVWCYWLSVLLMILRSRVQHQTSAGAVPSSGRERWMWLIWVPTIVAWQVLPRIAYRSSSLLLGAPSWFVEDSSHAIVAWLAALAAVGAYAFTVPCWLTLGSNWSLAVVPGKESSLITHGVYERIRHPIYALGLVLMAATVVVAPSIAMLIVGSLHLAMIYLKATNEEWHLSQTHGQAYRNYCSRTGRFFPRLLTPPLPPSVGPQT